MILRRRDVGNPRGYFAKSFAEYQEGFEENGKQLKSQPLYMDHIPSNPDRKLYFLGESWIGLDTLHNLTSEHSYGLKIIMTDFDNSTYVAFYNRFKVGIAYALKW